MVLQYLKGKIHRATVTDANLEYEGSITLGQELMEASGIREFERVEVYNITNGERFATYAIPGTRGTICINGAAAWKAKQGDMVIVAAYCHITTEEASFFKPKLVFVGTDNEIKSIK